METPPVLEPEDMPFGWSMAMSKTRLPGHPYYYNIYTGETTWKMPNIIGRSRSVESKLSDSGDETLFRTENDTNTTSKLRDRCAICYLPIYPQSTADLIEQILTKRDFEEGFYNQRERTFYTGNTRCICSLQKRVVVMLKDLCSCCAKFANGAIQDPNTPPPIIKDSSSGSINPKRPFGLFKRFFKSRTLSSTGKVDLSDTATDGNNESQEALGMSSFSFSALSDMLDDDDDKIETDLDQEKVRSFDINEAAVPSLSLAEYVDRIWRYSYLSDSTMVVAALYIARLVIKRRLSLSERNVYKMYLAAVMVAAKNCEDSLNPLPCRFFADVGGISLEEINKLERDLLCLLGWRLYICPEKWKKTVRDLLVLGILE